ncbi:hypothetical protein BH09ACT6_BH09ACT6_06920 [soil metagenome]
MYRKLNTIDDQAQREFTSARASLLADGASGIALTTWPSWGEPLSPGTDALRRKLIGIHESGVLGSAFPPILVAELVQSFLAERDLVPSSTQATISVTVPVAIAGPVRPGPGAAAERSGDGWAVAGTAVRLPTLPTVSAGVSVFRTGDATHTLGIGGVVVSDSPTGSLAPAIRMIDESFAADAVIGILTDDDADELARTIVLGVSAALLAYVDDLLDFSLTELRELKARREGKWAGQAFKHEVANVVMRRDIALLHALHCLEDWENASGGADADTYALLALIEATESCSAGLSTFRRLCGEKGDVIGTAKAESIRAQADLLCDLTGQGIHLRTWLFASAVGRN